MQLYANEAPATLGLIFMFLFSGMSKIFSLETRRFDANRLMKVGVNISLSSLLIILAGIFEVSMSSIILHDVFYAEESKGRLSSRSANAVKLLIWFTVLVTVLFYVFPPKMRPLLSNVSTVSGLFFVLMIIRRNKYQYETSVPNETILRVDQTMREYAKQNKQAQADGLDLSESVHGNLPVGKSKC